MATKWIQKAVSTPGSLHRDLGISQQRPIPMSRLEAAIKRGGKTAKRAQLAKTLRSFKH